jgi:hypothetical protein
MSSKNIRVVDAVINRTGYVINKKSISLEKLDTLKTDLMVSPQVMEEFSDGIKPYPIYKETEKKITKDEYLYYLMEADTSLKKIRKDRYCFVYDNSYIEMDIYPFWKDYAIVEVELTNKEELVSLPPEIKVIKEVTEDKRFKNSSLAKNNSFNVLE